MRRVMVRYKVKPDRAAENEALVRAVYEELARTQPAGLHYATFALEDGVSFAHLSTLDTEDGRNPLSEVEAFARFQAGIGERCEEGPVVAQLREVGSYRWP
jgi:L-rhamnose mutarotase